MTTAPERPAANALPPIDLDRLRELAGIGLSAEQIADRLGMSRRTLFNRMRDDPTIMDADDVGLSAAIEEAAIGVRRLAREGNLGATILFLRAKGGWRQDAPPAVPVNVGKDGEPAGVDSTH